jgi:hypothetical protein
MEILGVPIELLSTPQGIIVLAIVIIVSLVLFVKDELKKQNIACEKRSIEERNEYKQQLHSQEEKHTKEITGLRLELKECTDRLIKLTEELYLLKGQQHEPRP